MSKKLVIILIPLLVILIGIGIGTYMYVLKQGFDAVEYIELDKEVVVKTLKSYNIGSSNDTFKITTEIQPVNYPKGTTVSFSQHINYEIVVDEKLYAGKFIFDSNKGISSEKDNNTKYDVDITGYNSKKSTVTVTISDK
ncbi:MAG: hypothetical protein IJA94_02435 [Bacilli bacterium]|nr:hypothetical protein [Bacilli bacterium]